MITEDSWNWLRIVLCNGLSCQLVRKSATASRAGLAVDELGEGAEIKWGAKPSYVFYEK
jgi:hypothetical protein